MVWRGSEATARDKHRPLVHLRGRAYPPTRLGKLRSNAIAWHGCIDACLFGDRTPRELQWYLLGGWFGPLGGLCGAPEGLRAVLGWSWGWGGFRGRGKGAVWGSLEAVSGRFLQS